MNEQQQQQQKTFVHHQTDIKTLDQRGMSSIGHT